MIVVDKKNITDWVRMGTRKAFGPILKDAADGHPELIALTADVSNSANLGIFSNAYPKQFYNIGIAEQNMTAIACGMAKEGHNVFICSFGPFVSMRNYEAVRTLVGYMNMNVKIVAMASGMSLGVQGSTHYCLEDISLMKTIPNMMILSPSDVIEEAKCIEFLANYNGPAYLRLTGIDGTPTIFNEESLINIKKPMLLREGQEIAIISTGSITSECVRVARALKKDEIDCALYSVCCLKPIDEIELRNILSKYKQIFVVEEHFKIGGLGDIICDVATKNNLICKITKIGVDDYFPHAGTYSYVLKQNKLSAPEIRDTIVSIVKN